MPPNARFPQGSFRLGIDEYVKQREAKVMERLEGGGDVSMDGIRLSELSPSRPSRSVPKPAEPIPSYLDDPTVADRPTGMKCRWHQCLT